MKSQSTNQNFIAKAEITILAHIDKVWGAFVNPETIRKYMFGATVISKWNKGSPIIWKGEWNGRSYEDKGLILQIKPNQFLQFSHFSPLLGKPDLPENYQKVTIELSDQKTGVHISLSQDNNTTEQEREYSENNWKMMLANLKKLLEN